jgi:hypothetical protein
MDPSTSDNPTATNEVTIDESIQTYLDSLTEATETRINLVKKQLDDKKSEIVEAFKLELSDVSNLGGEMKNLELKVFADSIDKKDPGYLKDVKALKDLVGKYIQRYEVLENYSKLITEIQLKDLLSINNDSFTLRTTKLPFLKRRNKKGDRLDLTWNKVQKKNDFTLYEDGTMMTVNYQSCWNIFNSEIVFTQGYAEIFIEINSTNANEYHCIGVTNESYDAVSQCLGCQTGLNAYMVKHNGIVYINGTTHQSAVNFPTQTVNVIIIKLNLNEKTITFEKGQGGAVASGPHQISGNAFKVSTSMCSGGTVSYRFLPDSFFSS